MTVLWVVIGRWLLNRQPLCTVWRGQGRPRPDASSPIDPLAQLETVLQDDADVPEVQPLVHKVYAVGPRSDSKCASKPACCAQIICAPMNLT